MKKQKKIEKTKIGRIKGKQNNEKKKKPKQVEKVKNKTWD